jgi:hypothetical protein
MVVYIIENLGVIDLIGELCRLSLILVLRVLKNKTRHYNDYEILSFQGLCELGGCGCMLTYKLNH